MGAPALESFLIKGLMVVAGIADIMVAAQPETARPNRA
jgi:hypothetical protein